MLVEPEPKIEQYDLLRFRIAEFMIKNRLSYTVGSKLSLFIQQLVETIPLTHAGPVEKSAHFPFFYILSFSFQDHLNINR